MRIGSQLQTCMSKQRANWLASWLAILHMGAGGSSAVATDGPEAAQHSTHTVVKRVVRRQRCRPSPVAAAAPAEVAGG